MDRICGTAVPEIIVRSNHRRKYEQSTLLLFRNPTISKSSDADSGDLCIVLCQHRYPLNTGIRHTAQGKVNAAEARRQSALRQLPVCSTAPSSGNCCHLLRIIPTALMPLSPALSKVSPLARHSIRIILRKRNACDSGILSDLYIRRNHTAFSPITSQSKCIDSRLYTCSGPPRPRQAAHALRSQQLLRDNRLIDHGSFSDHRILHDNANPGPLHPSQSQLHSR